jgi:Fur family transcriptional regulator, peroxide stress response regulator
VKSIVKLLIIIYNNNNNYYSHLGSHVETKQKKMIKSILKNTTSHPSVEWIYERAKKKIPNISLGTVYRNLKLMVESGEVEVYTHRGQARYDGNTDGHYHFMCSQCSKIIDLDEIVDKNIEDKIKEKTGLKVTHHRLEVGGLCLDCQKLIASRPEKKPIRGEKPV